MKTLGVTAALAALAAAAAATSFSGAFLNSTDRNPGSSAATGNVEIQLERVTNDAGPQSGVVRDVILAEAMRPGESSPRTGLMQVTNSGSIPIELSLDPSATGAPALTAALKLQVDDCGAAQACGSPTDVYEGALGSAPRIDLATTVPAGEQRFVRLRLSWPAANDDPALYGANIEPTFKWIATSEGSP